MLGHVSEPGTATQMEAYTGPHAPSPAPTLAETGTRRPHGTVTGQVVVCCERFHFGLARVDDKDNIVDGDGRFSNVGRQYNLDNTGSDTTSERNFTTTTA